MASGKSSTVSAKSSAAKAGKRSTSAKSSSARRRTKSKAASAKTSSPAAPRHVTRATKPVIEQFWLPSDITTDDDVARDTFGAARLAELKTAAY